MEFWMIPVAAFGGVVGGLLALTPTWARVGVHLYRHGFDNHLCGRECCR